jgi:methylisocitrate lyase
MVPSLTGMAERYRTLLSSPGFIELIGVHDVLSAVVAETVGFQAVFLSGYGLAASALGNPDIGLTTLTETSLAAKQMINRLTIPVIVDADNGYGNEDNVVRTVRELEFAGAAGLVMEDQVLPKRCGHTEGKKVLPMPLYMRKLEHALRCRETPMVIVARTDASPLDEAISRAKAFHAAGADLTLIDGVQSLDHAKRIAEEVPGDKQINLIFGGKTPILSAPELHGLGFKVVLYSTPTLFLLQRALLDWLPRLHQTHDLRSIAGASVGFGDFQGFIERVYRSRMRKVEATSEPDSRWIEDRKG